MPPKWTAEDIDILRRRYELSKDMHDGKLTKEEMEASLESVTVTSESSSASGTIKAKTAGTADDEDSDASTDEWGTESLQTAREYDPVDKRGGLRHGGYGLVSFCSEDANTAWHDHPSMFSRESMLFAKMFAFNPERQQDDPCKEVHGLVRLAPRPFLHFQLSGVSDFDFESFLLALRPRLGESISAPRLPSILYLATKWNFPNLRTYALQEIPNHPDILSPIDKIVLARNADVPEWLLQPHIALSIRPSPLLLEEARILGVDATLAVSLARERILARRLGLIIGPPPSVLLGYSLWTHPQCWTTLCRAWKMALTEPNYRDSHMSAVDAIGAALDDLKAPMSAAMLERLMQTVIDTTSIRGKANKLCSSCDDMDKIREWVGTREDEKIAKRVLKETIKEDGWEMN